MDGSTLSEKQDFVFQLETTTEDQSKKDVQITQMLHGEPIDSEMVTWLDAEMEESWTMPDKEIEMETQFLVTVETTLPLKSGLSTEAMVHTLHLEISKETDAQMILEEHILDKDTTFGVVTMETETNGSY